MMFCLRGENRRLSREFDGIRRRNDSCLRISGVIGKSAGEFRRHSAGMMLDSTQAGQWESRDQR